MSKGYYWNLTGTQEQHFLELYDYCNQQTNQIGTDDVKVIEENGLISMTNLHWFQTTVEYILPVLLDRKHLIQDTFFTRCLQHKVYHPIDFLYEKYQAIVNNEPLTKETAHEYMKLVEAKGERKTKKK